LNSIPFVKKLIYLESLFFHPEEQDDASESAFTPKLREVLSDNTKIGGMTWGQSKD